jgi:hypothetical protein
LLLQFVEYGMFGTVQLCSATQLRPIHQQPKFPLKTECILEGQAVVVEKIGLAATRKSCAYHVRIQATGKVRPCSEDELEPSMNGPTIPLPAQVDLFGFVVFFAHLKIANIGHVGES